MKRIITLVLFVNAIVLGYAQTAFKTVWNTSKLSGTYAGSSNRTIKLPVAGGTYEGNWVKVEEPATNGTFTSSSLTNNIITVPSEGTYEVTISNVGAGFYWQIGSAPAETDRRKLMEITQWGDLWTWDKTHMFYDCLNLEVTAMDVPTLAGNISYMFRDCIHLTGNASFNTWNVSEVTNMAAMFYGAKVFNQPLSNWNTGAVQNMSDMFRGTETFNQPIGNWNTENVTTMTNMFETSKAFNQPLNAWNVSNVTNLNGMFFNSVFNNASLGSWTLKEGVTLSAFLGSSNGVGMDCVNFSNTLKGWAENNNTPHGLVLGAAQRTYGDQVSYNKLRTEKNWTINNANYDIACDQTPVVAFADISASIVNGDLLIQWKTESERNSDHFVVQISNNGETWHEVASVASKAENGDSNEVLEYQHTLNLDSLQLAGISVFIILLLTTLLFNRRNRIFIASMLCVGIFLSTGCTKKALLTQEIEREVLYIKITQIDKEGKANSDSDVIAVER
ncbi:BspA family leucine-rich repeat surface protein [Sphingobacterium corticibacterium]|uniref:BspA family leucine-rich repeat surface protein n=1 Tax=Sphingobacterium corticibacterium TaxID=2484746 RepID=A0A4Q6XLJ8_9SPHI|nr:BspA family leucine-rich repeat surface protein [Sphingobacterium corticibacterium]RZF60355.1 BspA family leucine-rich repeat surface protein [Sphingobacterium corticibacterium]